MLTTSVWFPFLALAAGVVGGFLAGRKKTHRQHAFWSASAGESLPSTTALGNVALSTSPSSGDVAANSPARNSESCSGGSGRSARAAEEANRGLSGVTEKLRTDLLRFRDELRSLASKRSNADAVDGELAQLTLALTDQLARRYDEIRRETEKIVSATGLRIDPLTELANRRAVEEWMHFLFSMAARYDTRFSVAIFDVDGFGKLTRENGQEAADQTLIRLGRILKDGLRDSDIVARYGRDEFLILLMETDLKGTALVCHRLRELIASQLDCTVSVGLTHVECADSQRTLMNRADSALYGAKTEGGNLVYQHNGLRIDKAPQLEPACDR